MDKYANLFSVVSKHEQSLITLLAQITIATLKTHIKISFKFGRTQKSSENSSINYFYFFNTGSWLLFRYLLVRYVLEIPKKALIILSTSA